MDDQESDIFTDEDRKNEKQAILSMKFLQAICCIVCVATHILGFIDDTEPQFHEVLFCGVYAGYALVTIFSSLCMLRGLRKINYIIEAVVSLSGFVAFIGCGFIAMFYVEHDIHMRYFTQRQERNHLFFIHSRQESIFSMVAAGIFLMEGSFMLDILGVFEKLFEPTTAEAIRERKKAKVYQRLRLKPFWFIITENVVRIWRKVCSRGGNSEENID
ncbi:uncharacterized protein LOC129771837 [Toxorhynchites rutilus septentrionalis]|uniref:uncharacterized protein LOC129771837 n=1 Tax=Toxorhynchites rutilus septentrionalis TaxID=329112 RepID=UPI002479C965|nr:uncharacterized protein LOC129771837 [Toxorhynchites rutilus septentrionalis]